MSFPPRGATARPSAAHGRNLTADVAFLIGGGLIMVVLWPGEAAFQRGANPLASLPFVLGAVVAFRGVLGRWPTGHLSQGATLLVLPGALLALYLAWRVLGG